MTIVFIVVITAAAVFRLIFEDEKNGVHLYNAVNDQLLHLGEVSMGLAAALWDTMDPNVFLLSDGQMLFTYLYSPNSLLGTGTHGVSVTVPDAEICARSLVVPYTPTPHILIHMHMTLACMWSAYACDLGMHVTLACVTARKKTCRVCD